MAKLKKIFTSTIKDGDKPPSLLAFANFFPISRLPSTEYRVPIIVQSTPTENPPDHLHLVLFPAQHHNNQDQRSQPRLKSVN